jgi:enoyl-CoA hydratase
MTYEFLTCSTEDEIAIVSMNRPPVNAISGTMYREIEHLFSTPSALGPKVRVVILRSAVRHFCAGNDLADFVTLDFNSSGPVLKLVRDAFFAISDCDLPVVAAVHGAALGSGVALAASCDVIVAADDARFGLPELSVGAMGGARHLARLLPQPLVRAMFLTAEPLPVEVLARVGAVFQVVPRPQLDQAAGTVARAIARHSPAALRIGKRTLNVIEDLPLKAGYEFEQSMTREMTRYPDSKEAVAAIRERRPPRYAGDDSGGAPVSLPRDEAGDDDR